MRLSHWTVQGALAFTVFVSLSAVGEVRAAELAANVDAGRITAADGPSQRDGCCRATA